MHSIKDAPRDYSAIVETTVTVTFLEIAFQRGFVVHSNVFTRSHPECDGLALPRCRHRVTDVGETEVKVVSRGDKVYAVAFLVQDNRDEELPDAGTCEGERKTCVVKVVNGSFWLLDPHKIPTFGRSGNKVARALIGDFRF